MLTAVLAEATPLESVAMTEIEPDSADWPPTERVPSALSVTSAGGGGWVVSMAHV
jgi:hypothetical protein